MRCVICGSPDPDKDDGRCMDCISAGVAQREAIYPTPERATPGAERPLKAGDEVWVHGRVIDPKPLASGAIVVAISDSTSGDDGVVFVRPEHVREALATAPPAPEEEEPMPCDRCQQNAETVRVPTGFSGEGEFLCGKCVSLMLGEAQELMEQAGVELQSRHASAERVRDIWAKVTVWRNNEINNAADDEARRKPFDMRTGRIDAWNRVLDALERALPPSTGEKS